MYGYSLYTYIVNWSYPNLRVRATAGRPSIKLMGVPCNFMPLFDRRLVKMSEFSSAVAYALSCLRQEHIVLKNKQLEVLQELYEGNDVFAWWLWQVRLLPTPAFHV